MPSLNRRLAERSFVVDEDGVERFHPLGSLGPAYRADDPALRRRLLRLTMIVQGAVPAALFLGGVLIGAEWRGRGSERYAAALLLLLLTLMGYRIGLRMALRGQPPSGNVWKKQTSSRGEILWVALVVAAALFLGQLLGAWLGPRI
jgi:hypothetical protein